MNNPDLQLFQYIQQGTKNAPAIFLLHGTGGTETDLLPLVADFADSHTVIGIRGNVSENGMNRFFKRLAEGVFDQANIRAEAEKLSLFLNAWHAESGQDPTTSVYIGYSNGANMILALLFLYPNLIDTAALLHPILPFEPDPKLDLSNKKIFLSWGNNDQIIPAAESEKLLATVRTYSLKLQIINTDSGHAITQKEAATLQDFIKNA
ncbi:MAG: alpha/beta hydrolase [Patescibacteria group bacterium]